ncbi:MAG: sulfatase [Thermoanaerobaculia bacterium]
MRPAARAAAAAVLCLASSFAGACREGEAPEQATFEPPPTRGLILISVDALRADHLGAYGYELPASPFFDSLAARGTLFEQAWIQYPATLTSHVSMLTGLYPQEHGVLLRNAVLSERIEMAPQRLRQHGFRTAGHTEGGFMGRMYGFDRGFEVFTDTQYEEETDVERTFARGLDFLSALGPEERFFLFLHTYTVHDPYDPPAPYRSRFWPGPAPDTFEPTGPNLHEVNAGFRSVTPEAARYFAALYDAGIRYFDDVLRDFFARLDGLGLGDETTVIITSDHGEEFLEHGRLVHEQLYPEVGRVPLLFVFPGQTGPVRIDAPVESVDLAPTLYELAGIPVPAQVSGSSLVPLITGAADGGERRAYVEIGAYPFSQTALVARHEGEHRQIVVTRPFTGDPDGTWFFGEVVLDTTAPRIAFEALSFHHTRPLEVLVDGDPEQTIQLPTRWTPVTIELGSRRAGRRVTLRAADCQSPARLGIKASDTRCLAFKLRGIEPVRRELFDLSRDPTAQRDLSWDRPGELRPLLRRLLSIDFTPRVAARSQALDARTEKTLRALGYLD